MATVPVPKEEVNGTITNGEAGKQYDVIIIGAGFSGIANLHRLRSDGFKCHIFESGTSQTCHTNNVPKKSAHECTY